MVSQFDTGGHLEIIRLLVDMLSAIVWPATVITIAVILRRDISNLMASVKSLRHKETEISFEDRVHEANKTSKKIKKENINAAKSSPRGLIIDSWLEIESALIDFARRHEIESNGKPFSIRMYNWHEMEYSALGKGTLEMLKTLRSLRNEAVHIRDSELTEKSAIEYQNMTNRVIPLIEQA